MFRFLESRFFSAEVGLGVEISCRGLKRFADTGATEDGGPA